MGTDLVGLLGAGLWMYGVTPSFSTWPPDFSNASICEEMRSLSNDFCELL